jgi:hypothetical protein
MAEPENGSTTFGNNSDDLPRPDAGPTESSQFLQIEGEVRDSAPAAAEEEDEDPAPNIERDEKGEPTANVEPDKTEEPVANVEEEEDTQPPPAPALRPTTTIS